MKVDVQPGAPVIYYAGAGFYPVPAAVVRLNGRDPNRGQILLIEPLSGPERGSLLSVGEIDFPPPTSPEYSGPTWAALSVS